MKRKPIRLGEILIEKKLITEEDLREALEVQKRTKEFLGLILVKRHLIREAALLKALSEQFNIPFEAISYSYIDWELAERFSPDLILNHRCFPLKKDDFSVTMAISNPLDAWAIKKAEDETKGYTLKLVLVTSEDIDEVIRRYQERIKKKGI